MGCCLLRDLPGARRCPNGSFSFAAWPRYYRRDADDIKANWDRLDPKRKAFLIAQRLLRLREPRQTKTRKMPNIVAMEKLAFGEPVLDRVWQLSGLAASQEWDQVLPPARCR